MTRLYMSVLMMAVTVCGSAGAEPRKATPGEDALPAPFVANPSLEIEDPARTGSPLGYPGQVSRQSDTFSWTSEAARTGGMGVRLVAKAGGNRTLAWRDVVLDPHTLYRFSCWYRTQQQSPQPRVIWTRADGYVKYPTAEEWTQLRLTFRGAEVSELLLTTRAYENGRVQWSEKDAEGNRHALNAIDLTVDLDDFELRELTQEDFRGNLIQNGGVEEGDILPPGWWALYTHDRAALFRDTGEAYAGEACMRVEVLETQDNQALAANGMALEADSVYHLSFHMKAEQRFSKVLVRLYTGEPRPTFEQTLLTENEWTRHDVFFETRPASHRRSPGPQFVAGLCFWVKGKGNRVWMDEVVVKNVEEEL